MRENSRRSEFLPDLVRIALPIALQNLIQSSVNMLDTVMVGRLGAAELAAVGLGNQVWFLLLILLFGTSTGAGVFTAQYWGKKDVSGVRRATGFALVLGLGMATAFAVSAIAAPRFLMGLYSKDAAVVGLGSGYLRIVAWSYPFAAASFVFSVALRGVERVRLALAATTVSLATNAFLNWVLIFGKLGAPAMGVEGAALATVISRVVEFAMIMAGAYGRKLPPAGSWKELTDWKGGFAPRFLAIAAPVILNEGAWALGQTVFNGVFARVGTDAIAAYNVTATISEVAMVLFMGMANASAVMLGRRIGEGERELVFSWAKRFALLAPGLGLVMGLLLVPTTRLLPLLFSIGAEPMRQAALMTLVLAATFPFKVFNLTVVVGICRSGGDTRFGAFFDIFGVWMIGVPLAFVGAFALSVEPWALYLLVCAEEIVKSGLGVWRLATRKWLRDVTAGY